VIVDVKVPVLAESVAEATLLQWQKKPGEVVARGDNLIDIETDKVVLEMPAPSDGVLKEVRKAEGEAVQSEEVIATIDTEYAAEAVPSETEPPQIMPLEAAAANSAAAITLSPSVRRLVAEHGLDAARIPGSGKGGRITRSDVVEYLEHRQEPAAAPSPGRAAAPPPEQAPPEQWPVAAGVRGERREPMSRLRARIAERLVEVQRTAAILTTFNEVNMQPVMELRQRYRETFEKAHGVRLGYMSFFTRAAVLALQRFPQVNAYIDGDDIVYHDYCDIGIAVASPRGLLVPILRGAEALGFADIEQQITEAAARARDGKLGPDELLGGTFTITNGGIFGSLLSTPILNPPQSAILGMHKIEERPVVERGEVVVRPMMYLALSYDHRIIDGREAVQFLVAIKEALEDPARMLLEV
jgi:2-oxoglutarate dehydrogenase E2 component (dihydrolipoamide succinyltransferase)